MQSAVAGLKKALAMLEKQLQALTQEYAAPLLAERGVGPVVSSLLLAEVGSPERFSSRDAFALYAGCAPLSKSSARPPGYRSTIKATGGSITLSTSLSTSLP